MTNLLVVLHPNVGTIYLEVLKPQQWKMIWSTVQSFQWNCQLPKWVEISVNQIIEIQVDQNISATSTIRSPSCSPAASAGDPPSILPMYWPGEVTMIHLATIADLVIMPAECFLCNTIFCTFATKPYHTIDHFWNLTLSSLLSVQVKSVAGEVFPLRELHQARRVRASCHSAI